MGSRNKQNPRKMITLGKYQAVLKHHSNRVETRQVLVDAAFIIKMQLSVFKHVVGVVGNIYKINMTAIYVPNPTGRMDVYWINPVRADIWHLTVDSRGYVWGAYSADSRNSRCWDGYLLEQICVCKLPTDHRTFDYRQSGVPNVAWLNDALLDPNYGLHKELMSPEVLETIIRNVSDHKSVGLLVDELTQ